MNIRPVLYLSYDGMTDPLGQSQVLSYLVELSKVGFQFHLISFEKSTLFEKHGSYIQTICDEYKIDWKPLTYTKKPPVIATLRDIRKMQQSAFLLQQKHNIKLVHCRSYIAALVGLKLKNKRKTKLLFDMRGFWADERIEGKIWNKKNPLFKLIYTYFKKKERAFLSQSDTTISLTHNGKKEILSWKTKDFNPAPIEVIPCCANLELFNPKTISAEQKKNNRSALKINTQTKVLGYIGSIGTWYMLEEMMTFYTHFRAQFHETRFLFISVEDPKTIIKEAKKQAVPLEEISVIIAMHKDVPIYISLFDFSVFFIRPTYSKKASSPVKQGELMAMGIPIICNEGVGDTDLIVQESKSGITINKLTETSFSKLDFKHKNFDAEHIREQAKHYLSLEEGVKKYARIYSKLLLKPSES